MVVNRVGQIHFKGEYDFQSADIKFFRKLHLEISHANLTNFKLVITAKDHGFFEFHFKSLKRDIKICFSSKRGLMEGLSDLKDLLIQSSNLR